VSWVAQAVESARTTSRPSANDSGFECSAMSRPTIADHRAKTPCTVASFAHLAAKHFFDATSCHRLTTDGTIDMRTHVHERSLPDGRSYDIVKRFHSPSALVADLDAVGFEAEAATTEWAFITAVARPSASPTPR